MESRYSDTLNRITEKFTFEDIRLNSYGSRHYSGYHDLSLYFEFYYQNIVMQVACLTFRSTPEEPTSEMWDRLENEILPLHFEKIKRIRELDLGLDKVRDFYYITSDKK